MAKAGRPRNKTALRYPSGQIKLQEDRGTDELRRQRSLALGRPANSNAGYDSRAASTLGRLFFVGAINTYQNSAGRQYLELYTRASGAVINTSSCLAKLQAEGVGHATNEDFDPNKATELRQEYLLLRQKLKRAKLGVDRLIDGVLVFDIMPHEHQLPTLRFGLDLLYTFFYGKPPL